MRLRLAAGMAAVSATLLTPVAALANGASHTAAAGAVGTVIMIFIVFGIGLYFVPTIIAFVRNKSNKIAILALNFFLGWSLIGWVVSLVWALSNEQQPVIVQQTFHGHAGGALPERPEV